ncbi:hypothetical protein SCALM49S_06566 [Streptomyces californicus]
MEALGVDSLKPYVDLLRAHPEEAALREVLTAILGAEPAEMAATVTEAAAAAERIGGAHAPYARIAHHFPGDPGVLAAMLLNYVRLQPGEALFLDAGVPHAYLDGLGVEIMANSDNVLRCGLTPKHIDVPELLRIVRFEATEPGVLRPEAAPSGEELYETPADEFALSRYTLATGAAPADRLPPPRRSCSARRARSRSANSPWHQGSPSSSRPAEPVSPQARAPSSGPLWRPDRQTARTAATMSRRTAAARAVHRGRDTTHI